MARLRTHLTIGDLQSRLKRQLEFALSQVRERNAQLSRTNAQLSTLNDSYKSEMAQLRHERLEKDKLFSIISQQAQQWQTLSTYLISEADAPRTSLAKALNEQASQNLSLVLHSLDFIFSALEEGQPIDSLLTHARHALKILEGTKSYLHSEAHKPPVSKDALSVLTPREQDVFQLLVDGKSHAEISAILLLSEGTVRGYRSRIMKKLDIESLAGLVKFAIKHNLTELD